jgi:hypothetical protein
MNYDLILNIYGYFVLIICKNQELQKRLAWDFSFFLVEEVKDFQKVLEINLIQKPSELNLIPPSSKKFISSTNSITYNDGHIRYNDYHGEALSIFDYKNEFATIMSDNLDRLHEISYLLILSRSGKYLDKRGIHKIHAFGICKNHKIIIGNFPMQGGKTTLFINMLKDKDVSIISDDTPLINNRLEILPFPIRVGVDNQQQFNELKGLYPDANFYQLDRKKYGIKYLMDITGFNNPMYSTSGQDQKIILYGKKTYGPNCKIKKCNKFKMLYYLALSLIIGLGLPLIREYYLEHKLSDYISITQIAFSRFKVALKLLTRSTTYEIELGTDNEHNVKTIKIFFRI